MENKEDVVWAYWIRESYWSDPEAFDPWQLCALSVGIDPNSMTADHTDYSRGPYVKVMWSSENRKNTVSESRRRLQLLTQDVNDTRFFKARSDRKLYLHEFVEWMDKRGIHTYPPQLTDLLAKKREWLEAELKASEDLTYAHLSKSVSGYDVSLPSIAVVPSEEDIQEPLKMPKNGFKTEAAGIVSNSDSTRGMSFVNPDMLDHAIDKAAIAAGKGDFSSVYYALKELVLDGEAPFKGIVIDKGRIDEEGRPKGELGGFPYTDSNGEVRTFTKNALSKRLKNRRDAAKGR